MLFSFFLMYARSSKPYDPQVRLELHIERKKGIGKKMIEICGGRSRKIDDRTKNAKEDLESFLETVKKETSAFEKTIEMVIQQGARNLKVFVSQRCINGIRRNENGEPQEFFGNVREISGFFIF